MVSKTENSTLLHSSALSLIQVPSGIVISSLTMYCLAIVALFAVATASPSGYYGAGLLNHAGVVLGGPVVRHGVIAGPALRAHAYSTKVSHGALAPVVKGVAYSGLGHAYSGLGHAYSTGIHHAGPAVAVAPAAAVAYSTGIHHAGPAVAVAPAAHLAYSAGIHHAAPVAYATGIHHAAPVAVAPAAAIAYSTGVHHAAVAPAAVAYSTGIHHAGPVAVSHHNLALNYKGTPYVGHL